MTIISVAPARRSEAKKAAPRDGFLIGDDVVVRGVAAQRAHAKSVRLGTDDRRTFAPDTAVSDPRRQLRIGRQYRFRQRYRLLFQGPAVDVGYRQGRAGYGRAMYRSCDIESHLRGRTWQCAIDIAVALEVPADGHVLGCGDGAFANQALTAHYRAVDGLDKAEAAIRRAQSEARGDAIPYCWPTASGSPLNRLQWRRPALGDA